MTEIFFRKMSGAGNDFIVIDAREKSKNFDIKLSKAQIKHLCDREIVGCDQLIIIRDSKKSDCFMEIFNSDGGVVEACGNATRCVAAIILDEKSEKEEISIETKVDVLDCLRSSDEISVKITKPKFGKDFYFDDKRFYTVNVGNPHAICFDDFIPDDEYFFATGKAIESHPFFPDKTNVEFAKITAENIIEIRVFERGTGETLACGTGACAVAVAAIRYRLTTANKIITRFKGGDLTIEWDGSDDSYIVMTGGYEENFTSSITI